MPTGLPTIRLPATIQLADPTLVSGTPAFASPNANSTNCTGMRHQCSKSWSVVNPDTRPRPKTCRSDFPWGMNGTIGTMASAG